MVVGLAVLEIEPSALKHINVSSPRSLELLGKLRYFKALAFIFGNNFGFDLHHLFQTEALCLCSFPD